MKRIAALLLCAVLFMAGCAVQPLALPEPAASVDPSLADGVNAMGIEMLKRLYPDMRGENFMISPASISLALSMTMNGAEGDTLTQMKDALHFTGMDMNAVNQGQKDLMSILLNPDGTDKVKVEIANALWGRNGLVLMEHFQDTCREYYDAEAQLLYFDDPRARDTINGWVNEQTHGMVPSIVDEPIGPDTVLFLINTLFFGGKWSEPFDPEKTFDGTFHKADGSTVTVPMMSSQEAVRAYTDPDTDCFGKSFGDTGRLEMLFIRPRGGLDAFVTDFSPEQLARIIGDSHESEILIHIPRFSYDTSLKLKEVLNAMGMESAFDTEKADFSAMGNMDGWPLYVGAVLHKTRIEVAEEGAKAAAVTSVMMEAGGMPTSIALDSPFLYLIRDTQTGAVLFMGVVEEPVEE